jgi:fructosamine-3-kinase
MNMLQYRIAQQLSVHFNQPIHIKDQRQIFGGDINQTFQLQTNIGSFFLKLNKDTLKDMFEKEFSGLQLLLQTGSIKIPEPVIHGKFENNVFLVTEFIQKGNLQKNFWQTFAQQLAMLHQHTNDMFGLAVDNYIGSLYQQNIFCETWPKFYATQRILPLTELAFNRHTFRRQELQIIEKLCTRFNDLFPHEKASLLHGDLWSGNFMCNQQGMPVLYDPAVYYGNREMDIAMSLLFGGFNKSFYAEYNEAFPLQHGWKERVKLCQLYPLLVHLILFGGHYYKSVMEIAKAYL